MSESSLSPRADDRSLAPTCDHTISAVSAPPIDTKNRSSYVNRTFVTCALCPTYFLNLENFPWKHHKTDELEQGKCYSKSDEIKLWSWCVGAGEFCVLPLVIRSFNYMNLGTSLYLPKDGSWASQHNSQEIKTKFPLAWLSNWLKYMKRRRKGCPHDFQTQDQHERKVSLMP
jgi:hypothetical protein